MLHAVVNGLWGVREEGPGRIAERWVRFLRALESVDPAAFSEWFEVRDAPAEPLSTVNGFAPPAENPGHGSEAVPLTTAAFRALLLRNNPDPDVASFGYGACVRSSGAAAGGLPWTSVRVRAGGSSEYVHGVCSVRLSAPASDAPALSLVRHSAQILRALAEAWEVDTGQAYTKEQSAAVHAELGLHDSDPFCGRSCYLSADRAALVPRHVAGTLVPTAHGGLLLDLSKGEDDPDLDTVLEANRVLRAAGALHPLPVPLDRATW